MQTVLKELFEEQVTFLLDDGSPIDGNVYIGETELIAVEVLREDLEAYKEEFNRWLREIWFPLQRDRREEILKLHANSGRYTDLCDAVKKQQVVPFIGSGMSVPTGLPTWSALLRKIRSFTTVTEAELDVLLNAARFEEAADALAVATSKNLLNERVEHDLRVDDSRKITGPVQLLPAIFPNLVITTNLDDLLEKLYARSEMPLTHIMSGKELAQYRQVKTVNGRFLLKLHGDCRRTDTRVLLTAEYEAAYGPGMIIRNELTLLYQTNHLLCVGCSLGPDRTIKLIEEVAKIDGNMPKHYAFLPLPNTDAERLNREIFLTERGIYPIWYDGAHDSSIMALLAGLLETTEKI